MDVLGEILDPFDHSSVTTTPSTKSIETEMIKLTPGRLYKGMTLLIALWGFLRNRAAFASPPFLFSGMLSFL